MMNASPGSIETELAQKIADAFGKGCVGHALPTALRVLFPECAHLGYNSTGSEDLDDAFFSDMPCVLALPYLAFASRSHLH
jgi:hypothetical protein